jgi:hypothetical protein
LALLVSVIARRLRAKFLLLRLAQLQNPLGKGVETLLDQCPLQAVPAQIGAYPERSLAPRRMISHEVFRVAPIIEQFFRAQRIEQRCNDRYIVTLLEQLTAQILGCVVAASERVERRRPSRARVEGFDLLATQGVTPL